MDLRLLINIIKRWGWLIILGFMLGGISGYFFSSRQTPVYEASTRFIVIRAAPTSYYELDYYLYDSQSLLSTYTELLSSESLLRQASEELGFEVNAGQAAAAQVGETQFINLTVKDTDPEKAAAIANVLVKVLIDQNEQLQSVRYILAEDNLQQRIDQAQTQMAITQDQIDNISTASVEESLKLVETQVNDLQSQIAGMKTEMQKLNPKWGTEEEKNRYTALQVSLDQLEPVLDLYQQIYTNLVVLGQPLEGSESNNNKLTQLQTTYDLYREIYISGMASLEDLRLARVQNTPNVIQTEVADMPADPISPKPLNTALLAAIIGLIITAGIAFLIEYLDDTLKTPEDVEAVLGLPVIGFIADLQYKKNGKNSENGKSKLFVASQPRSVVSEALRSLRTNLEFVSVDTPLQTVLITSAGPSEGKSTIAANLALSMAQGGKKTVLIDADMRRPSIHHLFGVSNRLGLSDLLRGRLEIEQVLVNTPKDSNTYVITSGSLPPNPAELLVSTKMNQILEELKSRFDIIILDSSPMVVADPQILSSRVDGVIFIAQPGKTRTKLITAPMQQLKRMNIKLLGVVFNRIPHSSDSYYGGYQYYSPYRKSGYNQEYFEESQEMKNP